MSLIDSQIRAPSVTNTVINTFPGVYKKNPSTPDLHVKCNLTSDNMTKIQPQTKVLIIKSLKTKSAAEVADIFSVSECQVERIKKRLEETGDVRDKPRSDRPRKTTVKRTACCFHSPRPALFQLQQSYMSTGHQKPLYLQEQFVEFSHAVVSMAELLLTNQH